MEINSLPQTSGEAGLSAATSSSGDTGVISSDFETFLVMLTAQIQNQDPLNPMDSSDYAVQLATFSGVEQQVLTNELLQEMSGATGNAAGLVDLAGWVGLEARVDGAVHYGGDPLTVDVTVPANAQWAQLVVRDAAGQEIQAVSVAAGSTSATWDGSRADGSTASQGAYTLELHSYAAGDEEPAISAISGFSRVTEVRSGTEGPEVVLASGLAVSVDQVAALREPGST